jgi:hypothetical protein
VTEIAIVSGNETAKATDDVATLKASVKESDDVLVESAILIEPLKVKNDVSAEIAIVTEPAKASDLCATASEEFATTICLC